MKDHFSSVLYDRGVYIKQMQGELIKKNWNDLFSLLNTNVFSCDNILLLSGFP